MEKREAIYEGKAKILYTTDDPDLLIQYFKDDATAFDAQKRGTIVGKGEMNNTISSRIFALMEENGVPTHFVKQLGPREMLVKRLQIIPLEVVIRNIVAGSLAKRMGKDEGEPLKTPIFELFYKDDALHDPMINDYHVRAFGIATDEQLETMRSSAFRINNILKEFFDQRGILLVDFKLEFGDHHGQILLGDEITPDGCRLWDKETQEKLDKDRFRRDLGKVEEAYQEVLQRVRS